MSLDVEPVEEIDREVDPESMEGRVIEEDSLVTAETPEYVLYGGKGGVGKTTCSAATALASAAAGTPTLVVSTDPAHSLSDTLGVEIPAHPSRIREDVPLYAAEIDPEAAMEDGLFGAGVADDETIGTAGGAGGSGDVGSGDAGDAPGPFGGENPLGGLGALGGEDGFNPLAGPMPGADEAAAMRQLLEHLDDPRFERVIVDTAPTGHTLRLLELPELLDSMVGKMVKLRQQFSGMMEGVKGMFGMGEEDGGGPDLDELRDRIERLRATLRDPSRTDFRVVMVPEEMSVVESERLVERVEEFGIPVETLVVNRVMEDPDDVASEIPLDEEWVVTPSLDSCEFCQRRWSVQQDALGRASDLFRGRDVKRVPLLAEEVRGNEALGVVAACLAA
ncbi:MAG: ArsA family ATPase [Halobaculum sp.]